MIFAVIKKRFFKGFVQGIFAILLFLVFFQPIFAQIQNGTNSNGLFYNIQTQFNDVITKAGFQDLTQGGVDKGPYEGTEGLINIISSTIVALLFFLGIVFLVLTIYGGYLWMTARGNEEQVKKAREIIERGTIGVLIILCAYIISYFVALIFSQAVTSSAEPYTEDWTSNVSRSVNEFFDKIFP